MLISFELKRKKISDWLLISFALLVLISAVFSYLFQTPKNLSSDIIKLKRIFKDDSILHVKDLTLKNQLGTFSIRKTGSKWMFYEPRVLPAKTEYINSLLGALNKMQIKSIYQKDMINLSNFSLTNPNLEIDYIKENGEGDKISVGLIIEDSTYISIDSKSIIYHVTSLNTSIDKLSFADIVDSSIFSVNYDQIQSFEIKKGNQSRVYFNKKDADWVEKESKPLNGQRVEKYINDFLELKSKIILDQPSEEAKVLIDKILAKPLYEILITDKEGNSDTFKVSYIIKEIPNIKMQKKQNFIIHSISKNLSYIIDKKEMSIFYKNQNYFNNLQFKKLFY